MARPHFVMPPTAAILKVIAFGIVALAASLVDAHALRLTAWAVTHHELPWDRADVPWKVSPPSSLGMDGARLDVLQDDLAKRRTRAFLVARGGQLAHEWYAPGVDPNKPQATACLAKGLVGSTALMLALDSGRIALDDIVGRYVPAWRDDPVRSAITIRQLATHSSGLDDVDLVVDEEAHLIEPLEGWKAEYAENSRARFAMALSHARVIYAPGTEYSYSGMAYYPLAYALAASLHGTATPDVRALLERRLMHPLAIPRRAWMLSYGEESRLDGLKLYAIGSGAAFTARAAARIGQLLLNRGAYEDRRIAAPASVDAVLGRNAAPPPNRIAGYPEPEAALGWWINRNGFWPSLPRDAIVCAGADDQVVLIVPSLDLVAVRFGGPLNGVHWEGSFWSDLDPYLFEPLMDAVRATEIASAAP